MFCADIPDGQKQLDMARFLVQHEVVVTMRTRYGWTAIYRVVECCNDNLVRLLLENGADAYSTAISGPRKDFPLGGEYSANIGECKMCLKTKVIRDETPLHWAVQKFDREPWHVVGALPRHGADLETRENTGATLSLRVIATNGVNNINEYVVELLLERGADLGATSNVG